MVTEAVVLAGGLGTRLRTALPDAPKAMAPIAGKPFLAYLLEFLEASGLRRVVLAVGYKSEAIRSFFGSRYAGLDLAYSIEEEPLGTGGALQQALGKVGGDFAFVLNGDTFLRIDYQKFADALHSAPRPQLAVALRHVDDASRYGAVVVADGRIRGFRARGTAGPGLINAGCYLVAKDIFQHHPMPSKFSWEQDFLEPRAAALNAAAFECDAPFIDIGVPDALAAAQILLPQWVNPPSKLSHSFAAGSFAAESFADPRLGADLLWRDIRRTPFPAPVPALFLDRDGVIIEEKEYISDPGEVQLLPGIPELIRAARQSGMAIVEITNQAGIGRGYFGWQEFVEVEKRLAELLAEHGASLDAVLACPFHSEACPPYRHPDHPARKPNAGMLQEAARLLDLDLRHSILVGDKAADLQAARAAGLECGIHVLTGYGKAEQSLAQALASPGFTVHVISQAAQAIGFLPSCAAAMHGHQG